MVSFVCGWQIWKTKTMFTNKKYHHSNFGHIHFCKPYTRNFKIFWDLGPAGSIITGRGSCMGLSVLVAEIWARNWWSKKPGLCLPAMSCQVLSIIIIIREWGTPLNLLWGCAAESMALSTCSRKKGIIRSSVPENNIIAKIGMIFLYWLSDKLTRGHTFISSLFMGVPGPPGFWPTFDCAKLGTMGKKINLFQSQTEIAHFPLPDVKDDFYACFRARKS